MLTIKVLSDKEFEALPYKHLKESYGIADKKKGVAFVRNMGMTRTGPAVQHELEELVSKFSDHEDEDGMRHGWFKKAFGFSSQPLMKIAAPIIGGALLGPMGAGMGALGAGLGAAAANVTQGERINPMYVGTSAIGGYMGASSPGFKAGVEASRAAGGGMLGQSLTGMGGMLKGIPANYLGTGNEAVGGIAGYGGTFGAKAPATLASSGAGALGGGTAARGASLVAGEPGFMKGLMNPSTLLGLGMMGMSSAPVDVAPPPVGDIASKWLTADTVTKAGELAKNMADVEYGGEFQPSKEISAFIELQGKDIDKAYKQRLEQLDNSMSAMNANWSRSGERLEMYRRINEEKEGEKEKMQSQWLLTAKQEHAQKQYNYVMRNLNVDEQVKRDLLYADISQVQQAYNLEVQDIMRVRELAANAGLYLAAGGMGLT